MLRFALTTALVIGSISFASAQTRVDGYYRDNGTYVQPHVRSNPNNSTYDNYSTRGNTNPYTGQAGTQDPNRTYNSNRCLYGSY